MSPERLSSPKQEQVLTPKLSVPVTSIPIIPAKEAESPIAFLLAVAQSQSSRSTDDDLTSLSWLHEKDILKGINLVNQPPASSSTNNVCATPIMKSTFVQNPSPTSDFIDESSVSATESTTSSLSSPIPYPPLQQKNKHPYNVPYDPIVHVKNKPPYSFSCLIFMAIENSQTKALPVKEIYAWILDHFPYFYNAPTGWKNSVRHNLSLNKCFQKVEKAPNLGKGSLWTVDPQYRPNLMQALTRSFHPSYTLDPNAYFKGGRLQNHEVFSFIPKTEPASELSDDSLDAVDAAAVMLSLKNGSRYRHRKDSSYVITNSPSEDHTYSASENMSVSNDEAFESDEERHSKDAICRKIDFEEEEEERRIKEGAETLLNLAGITTRRRSNSHNFDNNFHKRRKSNQFSIPSQTYEKPQHFRPRLLRTKKREKPSRNNNNNNNSDNKKAAETEDEWVKHRRELEDQQKR